MESAVAFVCIVPAIRAVLLPATAPEATRTETLVRIAIAVVLVLRRRNLVLALILKGRIPALAQKRTPAAVLALNRKNLTPNSNPTQQNGRRALSQPTNKNRAAPLLRRANHVTGASIRERAAPTQGLLNNCVSYTRLQQRGALDLEKLIHDGLTLFVAHEAGSVTEEGTNNTGSETGEESLYTALLVNGLSA